ncbi:SDR family oxidoreductase [Streptomyces sp. NBC_00140]|uniref:SDR family oxidoreductase n=1 Tax=Streptomyces sp. NBC_00140 TaxID=2975664 RepID=UPI00225A1D38|nr:NAD(P)H-binding protein [Streptomyces sp. NBC_00140]MCX5329350.1 NAD(P)H-binding protein [Streptomyces sp. NBC_00140]
MIVVTGATGNVGRELVRTLAADGTRVTATSRRIADGDVPQDVRAWPADLADAESLRAVLDGADALFLHDGGLSAHLLDVPHLMDVAKAGGVRRVVLLSSLGVVTRPESASHGGIGRAIDEAVRQSGLEWTILRPNGFHTNAFAWVESVRTQRTVAAPFGDVGLPTVDPADIAAVAAVALREDGHAGQTYELTGPALMTPRQQAAALGTAVGEPVRFIELSRDEGRAHLLRFMPEPVADTTLDVLGAPTPAEQRVSPDIERITGRTPGTFADWARRHAAMFR